ncbi:hypothetical protein J2X72_003896 [Phyllobacterium sp. 1468]|nr:hypothetical protein [Phyllobacterium sp. 1468]
MPTDDSYTRMAGLIPTPRANFVCSEPFCRREFGSRSRGLAADVYPSDDAEARRNWAKFARPSRISAWRTPTLSGGVGRWKDIGLATFRVDRLAIRETELALNKQNLL